MNYDKTNFWNGTYARFEPSTSTIIDNSPAEESSTGSKYWFVEDGVYRYSDHWGYGIEGNAWFYDDGEARLNAYLYRGGFKLGFCSWDNFEPVQYMSEYVPTLWNNDVKQFIKQVIIQGLDLDVDIWFEYGSDSGFYKKRLFLRYVAGGEVKAWVRGHEDKAVIVPDFNKHEYGWGCGACSVHFNMFELEQSILKQINQ